MKGIIYGGISTLLLTIAATSFTPSATAQRFPEESGISMTLSTARGNRTFQFNAPFISNSGTRNDTHFFDIMVVGMSLEDVMISLPIQMERFKGVRVLDESNQEIPAKIDITKDRVAIDFKQPVAAGKTISVQFTGVQMRRSGDGDILLYGVTARRTGIQAEIPVGTARVQQPMRG